MYIYNYVGNTCLYKNPTKGLQLYVCHLPFHYTRKYWVRSVYTVTSTNELYQKTLSHIVWSSPLNMLCWSQSHIISSSCILVIGHWESEFDWPLHNYWLESIFVETSNPLSSPDTTFCTTVEAVFEHVFVGGSYSRNFIVHCYWDSITYFKFL